jgi:hypothetical protein
MKRKLTREEYQNLHEAMREHPELFGRMPRTLAEHVRYAEQLALATTGKLPRRLTPKQSANFHNIRRRKTVVCADGTRRTLNEHVRLAKHLALATTGKLPASKWLHTHGHRNLSQAMRQHPEAFSHSRQDSKKAKTVAEYVQDAERLARKHGTLPNPQWLHTNGYCGLSQAMRQHPEAFDG